MGAPTKFSQERAEKLLQAVRSGNHLSVAARFAGISYDTLKRWVLKADEPGAPEELREFAESLERARAESEVIALAKIQRAASEGAWQASAWFLERSWPERWGRRETNRIEIIGNESAPVRVVAGIELDDASMTALAQRLATRTKELENPVVDAEVVEVREAVAVSATNDEDEPWWSDDDE